MCGVTARTMPAKAFASVVIKKSSAGAYHAGFSADGKSWQLEIETTGKGVDHVAIFANQNPFGEIADTFASFGEEIRYRDPAAAPSPDPLDPQAAVGHFLFDTTGVTFQVGCSEMNAANVAKLVGSTAPSSPNGLAPQAPPPAPPPAPPFP